MEYTRPGQQYPVGIGYTFDNSPLPTGLTAFGHTATLRYNDAGLPDTIQVRQNGPLALFQYSTTHMPTQARWNVSTLDDRLGLQYSWDNVDRLLLRTSADGNQERIYGYDAASRLTSFRDRTQMQSSTMVCEDPWQLSTCYYPMEWVDGASATYGYDAVGNRTDGGATLQYSSNRYQTFRGYTFEYDAEGNVTRKYNSQFNQLLSWNDLGQLASVLTDTLTVTYGYNGFGQRVKRTIGGVSTYFVYDDDDLLLEVSGSGGIIREYAHYPGVDQPHSMRDASGNVYYYAMEYPGHVSGLFNTNNQVVNQYHYNPWGETQAVTENVQQPFRYMARELDPITKLYYVRNRWYDPVAARFVSEDPIGLAGGINMYSYAANNPTNMVDPFGLKECFVLWEIVWEVTYRNGVEVSRREVRRTAKSYWCTGDSPRNLSDMGSPTGDDIEPAEVCSGLLGRLEIRQIVNEVRSRSLQSGVEHGAWLTLGPGRQVTATWAKPGSYRGMSSGPAPAGANFFLHGHPNYGPHQSGQNWQQSLSPGDSIWAINHPGAGILAAGHDTTSMFRSDWTTQTKCPQN